MVHDFDSISLPGDEGERKEPVDMVKEEDDDPETRWSEELRLVLIGKTGSGKSASGNTILGRRQFLSKISASSITQICQLGSAELAEEEDAGHTGTQRRARRVTVVDMPGFGDTQLSAEQIHAEIAKCVSLSAPGPHAFLLVVPIGRYTDSENQVACEVTKMFGEDAVRHHTVVLFTRGDDLEGIGVGEYLRETAPVGLKALIDRCGGRYHVFNNKEPSNSAQVKELLMKVDKMVKESNNGFYTNTLFSEAEVAIREEQERMLREREEAEGEEQGGNDSSMEEQGASRGVRRRAVEGGNEEDFRVERQTGEVSGSTFRGRVQRGRGRSRSRSGSRSGSQQRHRSRAMSRRRQSRGSLLNHMRREAALSPRVLDRVKILVTAVATGLAVGALLGALGPLAFAAGASLVGNTVGIAVGTTVAAASGNTALALGAVTGGTLGGLAGAIASTEAATPGEAARDTLWQVGIIGASAAVAGAAVGGLTALTAAVQGAASSTAALGGANAPVAQSSLASAAEQLAVATEGSFAAGTAAEAGVPVAAGSPVAGLTGPSVALGAAVAIARCVRLGVRVVRETVRRGTATTEASYTERESYEIHLNR